jgi:3-methyladenine DNA glycosylase AlkD
MHVSGCVALEQANPEVCYLERLAVLPNKRRQGFGKALVMHVISAAKILAAHRVDIGIIAEHTELKNWYRGPGFVEGQSKEFPHLPFRVTFMSCEVDKNGRLRASEVCSRLQRLGNGEKAQGLQRFFKTGRGEYGEGDVFVGLTVPEIRNLAGEYEALPFSEITRLLHSSLHEARMLALFILVRAYAKGDASVQERIFNLYLHHTRFINNWDLVDASAEHIVGAYLQHRGRSPLYDLAASDLLWDRRIAMTATFHYIKRGEFAETLRIAELLLHDREDLIHKAVGWMLREVGKRDCPALEAFLKGHYKTMPRTMLRYAIERFPEPLRKGYLRGEIS